MENLRKIKLIIENYGKAFNIELIGRLKSFKNLISC